MLATLLPTPRQIPHGAPAVFAEACYEPFEPRVFGRVQQQTRQRNASPNIVPFEIERMTSRSAYRARPH
eukprot:11196886-Lingulodinium_polyedra.AAC.1